MAQSPQSNKSGKGKPNRRPSSASHRAGKTSTPKANKSASRKNTVNSKQKNPARQKKTAPVNQQTSVNSNKNDQPVITETFGFSGSQRTNTLIDTRKLGRSSSSSSAKSPNGPMSSSANRRNVAPRGSGAHRKSTTKNVKSNKAQSRSNAHLRDAQKNAASSRRHSNRISSHSGDQSSVGTTQISKSLLNNAESAGFAKKTSSLGFLADTNPVKARPNKVVIALAAVVIVLLVVFLSILFNPKIYSGVKVGDVDVSGLTQDEAAQKIADYYSPRIENACITVYAGDDGRTKTLAGEAVPPTDAEQLSYVDENGNTCYWSVNQTDLGAYINYRAYAEQAYQTGRDEGGILTRIGSFVFGSTIDVNCSFNTVQLEAFATVVDSALGDPRVDWDISVTNGVATTVEGKDGLMANRDTLQSSLSQAFLSQNSSNESFTASVENAPVRIDESAAQSVADTVTAAIADGVQFTYGTQSWVCNASEVGDWITTSVQGSAGAWKLVPSLDQSAFSKEFFTHVSSSNINSDLQVSFEVEGDNVTVHTNEKGSMPEVSQARTDLTKTLFDSSLTQSDGTPVAITVATGPMPESLTFDEAVESNVITEVSSYTTTFTTYSGTEARNINIQIGASYLNNSVCKAGGEDWSFNDLVGDTTPDKGYQAAGSIAAGEYVDTYGGGICQVATTVFNALFESPYKIVKRYNHSLYISSYPAGRDAAIAWDMLDLTWRNETTSDVLVKTSVGTDSMTASLYSVPVEFTVTSQTGDWEEGDKYSITVEYDENLAKGYSYVKQYGTDGSKISVVRTVLDKNGNIIYSNTFASTYKAKDEIIVAGPGTEVNTKRTDTT